MLDEEEKLPVQKIEKDFVPLSPCSKAERTLQPYPQNNQTILIHIFALR